MPQEHATGCQRSRARRFALRYSLGSRSSRRLVGCTCSSTIRSDLASTPSVKSGKTIHDVDVEDFLTSHYSELDPDLENLKDGCGEGQDPIRSVEIQYGDVDGDGQDEAIYQGFTCMSGSGGVDYLGVVKLQPNGKLVDLPIAKIPEAFKGRDPFEGLRGHIRLDIEDGRLVERYPVYKGGECEACSEGGERKFVFRWDGHQLVLDNIVDIPSEKSGN